MDAYGRGGCLVQIPKKRPMKKLIASACLVLFAFAFNVQAAEKEETVTYHAGMTGVT